MFESVASEQEIHSDCIFSAYTTESPTIATAVEKVK